MLYKLSKVTFVLFLFYLGIFQDIFFQIPNALLLFGVSMFVLLLLHKGMTTNNLTLVIPMPTRVWIFFAFYSLFVGFFVAVNPSILVSSLMTYVQTLFLMIYIVDISVQEKSNLFFIKTQAVYSTIYMILMLTIGTEEFSRGRLSLSSGSNPNSDGLTLVLGIFCILLLLVESKKVTTLCFSFLIIVLKIYTIILTGSRKSFILVLIMTALWLIIVFRKQLKLLPAKKRALLLFASIMIFLIGVNYMYPIFQESLVHERLNSDGGASLVTARYNWASEAIRLFRDSPLVGVGFNHYRVLSSHGTYSHSTFLEIIANSGLIGTILYFSSIIIMGYHLVKLYFTDKRSQSSLFTLQYLLLLVIWMILATNVIIFYGIRDSIALSYIISYYVVEENNTNEVKIRKKQNGGEKIYV